MVSEIVCLHSSVVVSATLTAKEGMWLLFNFLWTLEVEIRLDYGRVTIQEIKGTEESGMAPLAR